MAIPIPSGIVPVKSLTTEQILYGDRVTSYRWEVLKHASGVDTLAGYLDGVIEPSANLEWELYSAVKGSGSLKVNDLPTATSGSLRIGQLELSSARIRPVLTIKGMSEIPLGVYLFNSAPEEWSASGRVFKLDMLDKCTVLEEDCIETTYTVTAGTVILQAVAALVVSAGETIVVDPNVTATLGSPQTWDVGTSKLQIVNDLLETLNYNALWVDGVGNFRTTPKVLPAQRSEQYEMLNLRRELVDGEQSIYSPEWARDVELSVPNKVVTVQSGTGTAAPLIGLATNTDPNSPYSYPRRGNRWKTETIRNVEVPAGTTAEMQAYLDAKARASLVAFTAVQGVIQVKHLPIPVRVSDVLRFKHAPAAINKRHVLTSISLDAHPLGLMTSTLQEVIDL